MKKKNSIDRVFRFLKLTWIKLYRINDTPQKIALGFGLGVFLGVMPGVGILVALILSWLLRLNRIAALLGTLLTNTWISFVTLLLSIKVGSAIMGLDWHLVYENWKSLLKSFSWQKVCSVSFLEIFRPVAVGYSIVSFCLGALAYIAVLVLIVKVRNAKNKNRTHLPG
jgi:uncharacterized protein (DUF2062 family)